MREGVDGLVEVQRVKVRTEVLEDVNVESYKNKQFQFMAYSTPIFFIATTYHW